MRQLKTSSIVFVFFATFCNYTTEAQWSYTGKNGPSTWGEMCEKGQSQSPVNLVNQVVDKNLKDNPFTFTGYDEKLTNSKLTNNGLTLTLSLESNSTAIPAEISGGGLDGTYHFAELHFHWGQNSKSGSEHWIDNENFPLEVQLVHFNKKYESLEQAKDKPDGLAVLATFFQIEQGDSDVWSDFTSKLQQIQEPKEEITNFSSLTLATFMPPETAKFYRYKGSLTTPDCFESVTWTVFRQSLSISEDQMSSFRALNDGQGQPIFNNFRPLQPLHGRSIMASFDDEVKVEQSFDPRVPRISSDDEPEAESEAEAEGTTDKYDGTADKYDGKAYKKYKALSYAKYCSEEGIDLKSKKYKPKSIDHLFLLVNSVIIFFMQCGFAFMEAGAVRSKNTVNILIKNWLDMCICAVFFWACGFGLIYGPDKGHFIGSSYFFFHGMEEYKYSKWFFQFVFAATAATLVSGSLAERCNFYAYIVYSILITGFIYPVVAHWAWHPCGWLYINGFHDFAGSAVVHMTGAVCAFVGCVLMGPRIGRFDSEGKVVNMPGHSVPLSALGGLILVFGFFSCNGTKQGHITHDGDGVIVAAAIANTALGTATAGLSTLVLAKLGFVPGGKHHFSFLLTMNGSLTGTVALCAGCNVLPKWGTFVIGGLAGPIFLFFNWLLLRFQIDDPLDAIPVHGAGGIWGAFAVHIFRKGGIILAETVEDREEAALNLGWNILGIIVIIVWTGSLTFIMFYLLNMFDMLRVESGFEFEGMDMHKHGESAYPAEAWVEEQYRNHDVASTSNDELSRTTSASHQDGLPPNMTYSHTAPYNDPDKLFPAESRLIRGVGQMANMTSHAFEQHGNRPMQNERSCNNSQ